MRRLLPHLPSDSDATSSDLTDDDLLAAYAFPSQQPWVRANFVTTLDGAIRGNDDLSGSISPESDQRVFRIARRNADVVLVGAGTVRAEDYRPSTRPLALVTRTLDLPSTLRLFADATQEHATPMAFTTDEAAASATDELRARVEVVPCGSGHVDLARLVATLAARGLNRIHCEGGPHLLGSLLQSGLLDELLQTIVPILRGGGPGEHLVDIPAGLDPMVRLTTTQVLEEDGVLFLRATVDRP
jgi:riboflavin biosynthesis pyrimidine reductase